MDDKHGKHLRMHLDLSIFVVISNQLAYGDTVFIGFGQILPEL